jgi:phospholipase C
MFSRAPSARFVSLSKTTIGLTLALLLGISVLVTVPGGGSGAQAATAGVAQTPIKHVVIILKENRSFDEYLGKYCVSSGKCDGATQGTMSTGQVVQLGQTPDPMPNDIIHKPTDWALAYDGGKMDGFDLEKGAFSSTGQNLAYSQMSPSQIPNYTRYAKTYAIGDRMFAPWKGGSFPNNVFSVAAQTGQYDASINNRWMYGSLPISPTVSKLKGWGCDSPSDATEQMMNKAGQSSYMFPCYGFKALPNTLDQYGIGWRFYGAPGDLTYIHNGLNAINSVRNNASAWSHVTSYSNFIADAQAGTLPAVSWVLGNHLEHPPYTACAGENETTSYLNAIMSGPEWSSTAVMTYWDEWGGFYDHVVPPQVDGVSYGFRVPLIVVSPFTKQGGAANGGSVSHTFYSALSVLKFIETNWGLPSLTPKDSGANNMMDLFSFPPNRIKPLRPKTVLSQHACTALTAAERHLADEPGD